MMIKQQTVCDGKFSRRFRADFPGKRLPKENSNLYESYSNKRKTIIILKKNGGHIFQVLFFFVNPIHLVFELRLFWPSAHATLKKGLKKLRVTSPRNPTSHFPMWTKERATLLGKNTRLFQVNGVFSKEKRALWYCKNLRVKFNVSDWHDAF